MKRYYELTKEEKLALTDDAFYQSVKLEGISRNIKPPITLDAAMNQGFYPGFQIPPDSVIFYEILAPTRYGSDHHTGIAFKTADEARRACIGGVRIEENSYGKQRVEIHTGDFSVREVYVTLGGQSDQYRAKVDEFTQDDSDFKKLCEECRTDLSSIHQEEYNRKVNSHKRAEYLSLAGGDESVAKAFWAKMEGTEFPAA